MLWKKLLEHCKLREIYEKKIDAVYDLPIYRYWSGERSGKGYW